jgi:hypothetical protein
MIFDSADAISLAVELARGTSEEGVGLPADIVPQPGMAVFGAPDQVDEDVGVGLRHDNSSIGSICRVRNSGVSWGGRKCYLLLWGTTLQRTSVNIVCQGRFEWAGLDIRGLCGVPSERGDLCGGDPGHLVGALGWYASSLWDEGNRSRWGGSWGCLF